jgi:DNA-directed RNA polymerase II subunit RPB2
VNLKGGDVIIGKTVPLRGGGHGDGVAMAKPFHDQSTTLRHNESGVSDYVFESRNGEGYRFAKVRVRSTRIPGIGDKFSSCHGQKGTVGMVFDQEDMPFVARTGQAPDMIINPHCIPSRMTMGQLYESILGKCGVHLGVRGDGTAFNSMAYEDICTLLERCGMERHGNEVLVHGQTGERIPCTVFMGPIYEQRLKHMVEDKIHSRSTGPKMMLTRQPAEGRSRDGGLRIGEMERDCMIAHGAGTFLKERMLDMSDRYAMHVGRTSGLTSAVNDEENICQTFAEDRCDMDVAALRVPYGWKLLSQELQAMAIAPRLETKS